MHPRPLSLSLSLSLARSLTDKGEPTPYGWPNVNSHFGVIDYAGFAKDNYAYYQAMWLGDPRGNGSGPAMVHLLPHWNWGVDAHGAYNTSFPGKVWAYGNTDEIELFINGVTAGRKPLEIVNRSVNHRPVITQHVEWTADYTAGNISAVGYRGGVAVASTQIQTAGAPAAIRLSVDFGAEIEANGQDVALIRAAVVDESGVLVPTASNSLLFFAVSSGGNSARVVGVGNGDPSCQEPDRGSTRTSFNGLARAVVQAALGTPGKVVITASSTGLTSGTVAISVV